MAYHMNLLFTIMLIINIDLNTTFGCFAGEKEALLKFKASFIDPWDKFSAWTDEDCCSWEGIRCDEVSGHVDLLDVSTSSTLGSSVFFGRQLLSPKLDPSLLELRYLGYLDLSGNDFQLSPIPSFLGSMKSLIRLSLAGANFTGPVPTSFGNLSNLTELALGDNSELSGELPTSLGMLSNLESLYVSYTSLNGTLSEAHFSNLYNLKYLYISYSLLKLPLGLDWVPPFQLQILETRSCDIGGQFPKWFHTQRGFTTLELSNCSISGTLPEWLQNNVNLSYVYLSHNNISGPIPKLPSSIGILDISHNMISGPLPRNIGQMMPYLGYSLMSQNFMNGTIPDSLCELEILHVLDLSNNQLSGNLPSCWGKLKELSILKLSSNMLSGTVPDSTDAANPLKWLHSIHLNNNSFTGKIPSTLRNCKNLQVLDIGENMFSGNLPEWIGNYLLGLRIIRARNNNFSGKIPSEYCHMPHMQIIDLANNQLKGNIPSCFGNFSSMINKSQEPSDPSYSELGGDTLTMVLKGLEQEYTKTLRFVVNLDLSNNNLVGGIPFELTNLSSLLSLNLSHNHLTGNIPGNIGNMKSLESLDLSSNYLVGTIPDSLSRLSSLSRLNLSHNNLSGKIPTGHQLQTLDDPSIYDDNPALCGAPLLRRCNEVEALIPPNVERHERKDDDDVWFYGVIISGFATGLWGFFGVLIFKRSWRHAYFSFVEYKLHKLLGV